MLVDRPGIQFVNEGELRRKKHRPEYPREWRKVHICIDARMLYDLLTEMTPEKVIGSVGADSTYDKRGCRHVIAQRVAVISMDCEVSLRSRPSARAESRNEAIDACNRLSRRLSKAWSGYPRRSLVETTMPCVKRLAKRITARTFERQGVGLHVRMPLLNRFSQIDCTATAPVAAMA